MSTVASHPLVFSVCDDKASNKGAGGVHTSIPTPLATSDSATTVLPTDDLYRATSLISIWGPCRRVGDEYLSCVVTSGMGMCKPLRRNFERCATETSEHALGMLDQLAVQACSHLDNVKEFKSNDDRTVAKRNCAAEFLLRSQPQGPMQ